jgi:hypothetical protein
VAEWRFADHTARRESRATRQSRHEREWLHVSAYKKIKNTRPQKTATMIGLKINQVPMAQRRIDFSDLGALGQYSS